MSREDVLSVLDDFSAAFARRDREGVLRLFASDSDVVVVTPEERLLRGHDALSEEGEEKYSHRMTMICENRHWLLRQVHGSSPQPAQPD